MVGQHGVPDGCPLRCRLRRATAGDDPLDDSATDPLDWAGLPVNLDLVFSPQQRDKVYAQHLRRKRETQAVRWSQNGVRPCACAAADEAGYLL